jgi:hypothetical protein
MQSGLVDMTYNVGCPNLAALCSGQRPRRSLDQYELAREVKAWVQASRGQYM